LKRYYSDTWLKSSGYASPRVYVAGEDLLEKGMQMWDLIKRFFRTLRKKKQWSSFFKKGGAAQYFKAGKGIR